MSEKSRNGIYKEDAKFWMKQTFWFVVFTIMLIIIIGIRAIPVRADNSVHQEVIESLKYIHSKQIECVFEHSHGTIRFYDQERLAYLVDFDHNRIDIPGYTYLWLFGEAKSSFMVLALPDDSDQVGFMVAEIPEESNYSSTIVPNRRAKVYSVALLDITPMIPYDFSNLMFSEDDINIFSFTEMYLINGVMIGSIVINPLGIFAFTNYVEGVGTTPEEILSTTSLRASSSRAKGTLRSLGSSELAYQGTNDEKVYGTFAELQEELYIASEHTPENMISNYNLYLYCGVDMIYMDGEEIINSWFVILAMPNVNHSFLNAFMITEDQAVRGLNPDFILSDRLSDPEYLRSLVEIAEPIF